MAFQTPLTIKKTLEHVQKHEFVLPSIQREFVWKPSQICRLFDSLMQGYPIGSFLFWRIEKQNVGNYKFYDFVRNYHERDDPHCPVLDVSGDAPVTAVLDGQQRLTALNIGLRGSHAEKEPRKWWNNPEAFPQKWLYLNLLAEAGENEEGMKYEFEFLTEERAAVRDADHHWFPVRSIMNMQPGIGIFNYLVEHNLNDRKQSYELLDKLHRIVHAEGMVSYYAEESQELEKVLNIFIRTNSGGTVLSYSDLLLSIAVAQRDELDARKEIHDLVDELNDVRAGFAFSKDFVLKAGLMLCDIASVGFKVTNFNQANMALLEENWKDIARALKLTARLVGSFGFSAQTLTAVSAVMPIAYYLYQTDRTDTFLTGKAHEADRQQIKGWLIRSLLKSGVWGSGLDTTLTAIRAVIQSHGKTAFPVKEIEMELTKRGRTLRFEEAEIQDVADMEYGDKRSFAALALLFPFVDLKNEFHVDHVFPISRFSTKKLTKAGVSPEHHDDFEANGNRLANLQLLEGSANVSKNDQMPAEWLKAQYPSKESRQAYQERHMLGTVPEDMSAFPSFYASRRAKMIEKLRSFLGSSTVHVKQERYTR